MSSDSDIYYSADDSSDLCNSSFSSSSDSLIDSLNQAKRPVKGKSRNIVVRFQNRIKKDAFLSAARKSGGFASRDIGMDGESKTIYINEHLTLKNKQLLNNCKAKSKDCNYKYSKSIKRPYMSHKLTLLYQNVRGLRTKTTEFYNNLLLSNHDIILVTETWLNDGILDSELSDNRYEIFRRDRGSNGGGVMVMCGSRTERARTHRMATRSSGVRMGHN
ncbi:hypothetical protein ACJJTC_011820 [Scirpophaga incertulas]